MNAACHALRYIKGKSDYGILLEACHDLDLAAYYDYDEGACRLTRISLIGYLVIRGGLCVSWKTKKQTMVLRSSA